jgi:hypothetical protein
MDGIHTHGYVILYVRININSAKVVGDRSLSENYGRAKYIFIGSRASSLVYTINIFNCIPVFTGIHNHTIRNLPTYVVPPSSFLLGQKPTDFLGAGHISLKLRGPHL